MTEQEIFRAKAKDESYPQRDFHTMYVGKIEKVLVRDDEYLASLASQDDA